MDVVCTADLPAFAVCPDATQLQSLRSLPSPQVTLFPRPTSKHLSLQGARSILCASCPRHEVTFRVGGLLTSRTGSCWNRRGCNCRTHRLLKGLWQLRQGLVDRCTAREDQRKSQQCPVASPGFWSASWNVCGVEERAGMLGWRRLHGLGRGVLSRTVGLCKGILD